MLSKKAQQLLSKESKTKRSLKFQLGGPTVNIDPTFNPLAGMEPETYDMNSSNYQMNFNQPLQQDLNSAQNYNYNQIQNNVQAQQGNPIQQSQLQTPTTQPQGSWMDYAGGAGKIAYGIKSLVDSQDEKKKAKVFARVSKEENDRRLEAQRQTGYVLTPYTNRREWSMKKGGMYIPMPSPSYQQGGLSFNNNIDQFLDSYNNQLDQQQMANQMFQEYYDTQNDQKKMKWKDLQKQGMSTLQQSYKDIQAVVGKAVGMMQAGGSVTDISQIDPNWRSKTDSQLQFAHDTIKEQGNIARQEFKIAKADSSSNKVKSKFIDKSREKQDGGEIEMDQMDQMDSMGMDAVEQPDTESLYSPDFQSPYEQEQVPSFEPEQSLQSSLESWIFQDNEPPPSRELSQAYDRSFSPISYSSGSTSSSGSGSMSVIDSIKKHESGGNPEATNMIGASGYYQFTPAWADKIAPFMGLPANTPKAKVMEAFRKNPKAQDDFMQYVVEKIYKPEIEALRPLASKYNLNDDEMVKFLHYRGIGDTRKRLRTGDFEVSQEEKKKYNNPDILTYIKSK